MNITPKIQNILEKGEICQKRVFQNGIVGPTGPQGEKGPTGPASVVSVSGTHTVSFTEPASVDSTFTPNGVALLFNIPQGVPGEIGPMGPQGIVGPTGPSGSGSTLGGLQAQLVQSNLVMLQPEDTVVFNTILTENIPTIMYDNTTGIFTFSKKGTYYISWWVIVDGTSHVDEITMSFTNGSIIVASSLPVVTGQLSGSTLVTITGAPEKWFLKNTSGDIISLSSMTVHASITIVGLL